MITTPLQHAVESAVEDGSTLTEIATRALVDRTHLGRWLRGDAGFAGEALVRLHELFPGADMVATMREHARRRDERRADRG